MKFNKKVNIVGVMNGTSLDGIDYVLCQWNREKKNLVQLASCSKKFPAKIKEQILLAVRGESSLAQISLLHQDLGKMYYAQLKSIIKSKNWKVDLVGLHGQTVFHRGSVATCQIGEPSYIAKLLSIPVVYDFRQADIVQGGQGAPLAGIFHEYLNKKLKKKYSSVAFQNFGGIANTSFFKNKIAFSYDSGPANMLMDMHIQSATKDKMTYDPRGKIASSGKINPKLLSEMLKHPYFKKNAPKSCGREEFGEVFYRKYADSLIEMGLSDAMASLSELTAQSLVDSYKKILPSLPSLIVFCGGGALNSHLVERIQSLLGDKCECICSSKMGWQEQDMEGAAFAYLAALWLEKIKSPVSKFTGAQKDTVLGKFVF